MEMEVGAQPECRALGVLGKLEMLGERQVVVELLLVVLDQRVVQHIDEIVRRRAAVMLSGSSQRGAILVCHANVIFPVGVILSGAPATRTNGATTPLAANAAECNNLRRVSVAIAVPPVHIRLCFLRALMSEYTS